MINAELLKSKTDVDTNLINCFDFYKVSVRSKRIKPLRILPNYNLKKVETSTCYRGRFPVNTYYFHIAYFQTQFEKELRICEKELKEAGFDVLVNFYPRD